MSDDLLGLHYETGAIAIVIAALVKTHPDPGHFAAELRLIVGDLQLEAAAAGAQMPPETRSFLDWVLKEADAESASR